MTIMTRLFFTSLLALPLTALSLPEFMADIEPAAGRMAEIQNQLEITPESAPLHTAQWFGNRQTSKPNQANIPTYQDSSNLQPSSPLAALSLPQPTADVYLRHGVYGKAAALFQSRPQTTEVRLQLAKAQAGMGNTSKALTTLTPLLTQNDPAARAFHGHLLLHAAEVAYLNKNNNGTKTYLHQYQAAYGESHEALSRYHRLAEAIGQIKRTPQNRSSFWQKDSADLPQVADEKQFFRVGVLLPLTGKMAPVGQDILRGLQMSLFDKQAAGSQSITILYPQDTEGTPQGAAAATSRALKLGVDMLIGPISASNVEAAASVARRSNTPLLAFSSTAAIAAPDVYLLGYVPQQQAKAIARHSVEAGKTLPAALVPSTEFGYEVLATFSDELKALGVPLTQTGFYNPQNADVGTALTELLNLEKSRVILQSERRRLQRRADELGGAMDEKDRRRLASLQKAKPTAQVEFDSLFLPATATGLSLITAQMATYDADKADFLLLGTAAWNLTALTQTPPEYVNQGRFFAPDIATDFIADFKAAYGSTPHPLAVLGYDAASIAQSIATEVHNAGQSARVALLRPEGFAGLGGALKFMPDGTTQRAYAYYHLNSNGPRIQTKAPKLLPPLFDNSVPTSVRSLRIPTFDDTNRFLPFR